MSALKSIINLLVILSSLFLEGLIMPSLMSSNNFLNFLSNYSFFSSSPIYLIILTTKSFPILTLISFAVKSTYASIIYSMLFLDFCVLSSKVFPIII